jgi:cell division protein FtsW (lipid II flippase)
MEGVERFAAGRFLSFRIRERRVDVSFWGREPRLAGEVDGVGRSLWLPAHRRYALPPQSGYRWLEYRQGDWLLYSEKAGRWEPFRPLAWGAPMQSLSLERRARLSLSPMYSLEHATSACPFPLTPEAIPGGLALGSLARLIFLQKRLYLQHIGQSEQAIQIASGSAKARQLGAGILRDGDHLSIGQIRYRVRIREEGVRMIADATPTARLLIPFFAHYPSERIPARKFIPPARPLLVTGGSGDDPLADRWLLKTPLIAGSRDALQGSPQRPFFRIAPIQEQSSRYQITPLEDSPIYRLDRKDEIVPQAIQASTPLLPSKTLYLSRGKIFRFDKPSYRGLAWRIAVLWVIFGSAILGLFFWLIQTGRLLWSPRPSVEFLASLPPDDLRRRAWLPAPHSPPLSLWERLKLSLLSWPILLLLPLAIFLNGMGLYTLASLSLASLGLNNSDFLYRQVLWSLVGMALFLLTLLFSQDAFFKRLSRLRPPKQTSLVPEKPPKQGLPIGFLLVCLASISLAWLTQKAALSLPLLILYGYGWMIRRIWFLREQTRETQMALYAFFATLGLLGLVPLLGVIAPPLVHNRFFLIVPGIGTIKLSDLAILAAILFFALALAPEIFSTRLLRARRRLQEREGVLPSLPAEASLARLRQERLGGAIQMAALYLLLLGAIGVLYTIQGDLGPGLILTLCFSLFLLFSFLAPGADRLTSAGNLLRIGVVFLGMGLFVVLPEFIAWLAPDAAEQSGELRKVQERLALWRQPWRFLVGEQILQNSWALAGHRGTFQWFNNLHSDFVFTAVVRCLSPLWGGVVVLAICLFPLLTLGAARLRWPTLSPQPSSETLATQQHATYQSLVLVFGGIYLFAQGFIHLGSVLRLTPMTGVTLPWISSGGTNLVVCYAVIALLYRQLRDP